MSYYHAVYPFAGFWRRALALLIDSALLYLVFYVVFYPVGSRWFRWGYTLEEVRNIAYVFEFFLGWLYFAGMESSSHQATLGKKILGITVTDLEARPISFLRASIRYFGKYLSGALLGLGFLMAAFTARRQALHDMIAGTLVFKKRVLQESRGPRPSGWEAAQPGDLLTCVHCGKRSEFRPESNQCPWCTKPVDGEVWKRKDT